MDGGPKGPRDDFFCWKFRVWYNLKDCVFRHAWQTHAECADCAQGAANLRLLGRVPPAPRWAVVLDADDIAEPREPSRRPSRRTEAAPSPEGAPVADAAGSGAGAAAALDVRRKGNRPR